MVTVSFTPNEVRVLWRALHHYTRGRPTTHKAIDVLEKAAPELCDW